MSSRTTLIIGLVGLVAVIGLTFVLDPYRNYQLATIAAYLCVVAGLTMLTGVNGQLSLGHAALAACGAYCYAFTANGLAEQEVTGPVLLILPILAAVAGAAVLGASPLTTVWILSISLALCYAAGWLMGRRVVTSSPA